MKRFVGTFLLLIALFQPAFAGKDSLAVKYSGTITAEDLNEHLQILASPEYEGRETGEKGQKLAAKYLADYFQKIGIEPLEDDSYYQPFPLKKKYNSGAEFKVSGQTFRLMNDFFFFRGFDASSISVNEVVFAGYGEQEEEGYIDYTEADVKGKTVMILAEQPTDKKDNALLKKPSETADWVRSVRIKVPALQEAGAKEVIVVLNNIGSVTENLKHFIEGPSLSLDVIEAKKEEKIPSFYVSNEMADAILAAGKTSVSKLKRKMRKKKKSILKSIAVDVQIDIDRKQDKLTAENVLGFIEGTDLKEEVLVITAHYDHLGIKDGKVHPGADDDGSGTVSLLEIAQAFQSAKKEGNGPRRSILIMPVAGEEKGLLGSRYYTDNPVFDLENTVANLNIDMIGRTDKNHDDPNYVYLIGSDRMSSGLHQVSENANKEYVNMELDYTYNDPSDPNRFYYRSDHYNFAKSGIPVIFYFSGVHDDYHKPTDTVDKIDFNKVEKTARLVFFTAWELANRDERVKVDVEETPSE